MLQELGIEIMLLLEEKEGKDVQITELRKENEELRAAVEPLNTQIANLQAELENKAKEIEAKNIKIAELQEQANLKLDEIKAIVAELKGLIANA